MTLGIGAQCLSEAIKSHNTIPYGMHGLPQFWDFINSIATLTTDVSVFGPPSVADTLGVVALPEKEGRDSIKVGLTTRNSVYLHVGPPQEIHHHVWFEGFQ